MMAVVLCCRSGSEPLRAQITFWMRTATARSQRRSSSRGGSGSCTAKEVRNTPFLSHFYTTNDHFTKTGSGLTYGKLKKEVPLRRR